MCSSDLVLNSPDISCNTYKGKYCLRLNTDGSALVEIPFEVTWNYHFLTALRESLSYSSDSNGSEKFTVISKKPGSFIGNTDHYWFIDKNVLYEVKKKFVGRVYVKGSILDIQNKTLFTSCKEFYQIPHVDYSGFTLDGNEKFWNKIYVDVSDSKKLQGAQKVEISIVNRPC